MKITPEQKRRAALYPKSVRWSEPDPKAIREKLGMSQSRFADFLSISVKTLHKWEQQTAAPSGPARGLLRIAAAHPELVMETLR